jgi:transcription-repair coupling factor (superfamily II helicase)
MHLLDLFESHPVLSQVGETLLGLGTCCQLTAAPSPAWGTVAADLQRRAKRTILLITPNSELAERCTHDLHMLLDEAGTNQPGVLLFPVPDRITAEELGGDARATQDRLATLDALHREPAIIVVAPVNALAHTTLPPRELRHGYDKISVGQTLDRDAFIQDLVETGFERVEEVEAPGQFAVRGGLIDFYPPASQTPLRLELFGDEVDSLRAFDLATQRSTDRINEVRLTPPREEYLTVAQGKNVAAQVQDLLDEQVAWLESEGLHVEAESLRESVGRDIQRLQEGVYFSGIDRYRSLLYPDQPTLFEHLPAGTIVIWADPARCRTQIERLIEDEENSREASAQAGALLHLPASPLCHYDALRQRAAGFPAAELFVAPEIVTPQDNDAPRRLFHLDAHLPPVFGGKIDNLLEWLRSWQHKGGIVVLSTAHARRVREILADGNIGHVHLLDAINQIQNSLALVMPQRLTAGFMFESVVSLADQEGRPASLAILSDTEMFGWQASQLRRAAPNRKSKTTKFSEKSRVLTDLAELKDGDYVVHINHGIARYAGVVRQEVAGSVNDYLLLEYAAQDRLYVPVQQLDRIQKYMSAEATPPALNQLKGNEWERTKKRVREETIRVAKQLAELYAAREQANKAPVANDTPWQREMESAFPYEETPSQLQAIKDVKVELESDKPMDRLVCGDVGFGKTEVAVRAAFKIVQDGKQVCVLVPTTVLAQQHYQTFAERFAPYPIRVEVLSRFRTPGEQKKILEDVRLGAIDILIGTHRLLQKDVEFRDLGLMVVDEEQRFGVMQKERLKEMRQEVDILTLSATPIPRTLHFALGGLREISLINDPPQGRLPVRTFVMPYRDEIVRQAIERELEREGQVYYVHNRISSIYHIAEHIHKLVPHARIGIGHGQMADDELEQVMLDFMHARTDILLSTTIIENGLDLPNVNTLIVDRSELLGLSQMYQLRGRVGRSSRQAYAYFFSGSRGKLGEEAESRFAAIQEYSDLGAGFKIAMRDLEIRGAGELLGVKQSGNIQSVGFELYSQMLNEAVRRLRHQPIERREELPEADLPVPAYLPAEYVPQERERLNLYRKMANVSTLDEVANLQDELRDRFGPLPTPVFNLLRVLKIRVYLLQARLRGITKSESEVLIRLKPGDRFEDADTSSAYARLSGDHDRRALQHISLRPMEGLAIDTRLLTPAQLLRMVEQVCEALATVRGARLMEAVLQHANA